MSASSSVQHLVEPFSLGKSQLANRVVMSPMTRCRAIGNLPNALMAEYYSQRAEAGLIVTEGTSPSPNGLGYARIPGCFDAAQVAGWRLVTSAVHDAGGKIFVQLMHTGRVSNALNMPPGAQVVAPSAVALTGSIWTDSAQQQPYAVPRAMLLAEVREAIVEYTRSARLAIEAGFDGVELHGANGYLIDQFFNTATNQRTDEYGGSVENRIRFAVEVARSVGEAIGFDRVGMRLSPYGTFNDMRPDPQMDEMYERLALELHRLGLVYLHVINHGDPSSPEVRQSVRRAIRNTFKGALILAGRYDVAGAERELAEGNADLIGFGGAFLSNPRLVSKIRAGSPFIPSNPATYYTPGAEGYTDYPV
ncbi:MAG TPA: alkene reductase [Polyangiaceae bacterium]|nr:alkene reductase [Polyangiaceae bacterium]